VASRPAEDQRPVLIMAQDEGRFGRVSRPRACWAPPGVRPAAPCQLVREFVQVFAAVAPATGELISLILPTANTAMMNLFLAHVSETLADFFIVMQVDQAGWHHSRTLQVPSNIRLIAQPAHSPEVNPVEHLWEELREKYLHNLAFLSLDALEEQLCEGLQAIMQDKKRIGSLMGFPHLKVVT
jgi:DDE superfamily endonuclease